MALECGAIFLVGTIFFDSVNDFCKKVRLIYMPFVGKIKERLSVLYGEIDDMINETKEYISKGEYGIDLLGYRYTGDPIEFNRCFVSEIDAPVCLADTVNSYERFDEIIEISPWSFTIGNAFLMINSAMFRTHRKSISNNYGSDAESNSCTTADLLFIR